MNGLQRGGTLTDRRGDAFYRTVTNVSDGEDPGDTGLKQKGVARQFPAFWSLAILQQIRSGEDKPCVITNDHLAEKLGAGHGANKDKHRFALKVLLTLRVIIHYLYLMQPTVPLDFDHFRAQEHLDVVNGIDLLNQIARHAYVQG